MTPEERRVDELRRQVAALDKGLSGLRRRLDDAAEGTDVVRLGEEVRRLTARARQLDQVAGVRDEVRRLGERAAALDRRLDEQDRAAADLGTRLTAAVTRLDERLARLEGVTRASPGARLADLDGAADDDVRALAERAERGAVAAAARLDPERLRALQAAVAEDERLRAARDRAVEDLVAASNVIARSEPGASGRASAVQEFTAARAAVGEHRAALREAGPAAERARGELEADRRRAVDQAGLVEDGRAAHTELLDRARARLAAALDSDEMTPAWLDAALGTPPADRDPWLPAAADLLAYRWTYGVTGAPALGDPPGPDASARRREWHRGLTARSRPVS